MADSKDKERDEEELTDQEKTFKSIKDAFGNDKKDTWTKIKKLLKENK